MNDRTESMRQLVDMALQSGRKRQNSQTGYIHHFYHSSDDEPHVTIPLAENFHFALALLKSRTIENVNEAKSLLEGLLHFQNLDQNKVGIGNFPIYIHDYPLCKDRFTCVSIAMTTYWILKLFHQVLGSELKRSLENSLSHMLTYLLSAHSEKAASYVNALKIGALCQAGGQLLHRADLIDAGAAILDHLKANPDPMAWGCPTTLGMILSALVLIYPSVKESPWSAFWNYLEDTWHQETYSYVGPAFKEWQGGDEPQVTIYDLFLGYYTGGFSNRALKDSIVHLDAVLIPHSEDRFAEASYPKRIVKSLEDEVWHIYQNKTFAYCFVEKYPELNPAYVKGFHPLRIVWGDKHRMHSFVCQGGNAKKINFFETSEGIDITFELNEVIDSEDREKNREAVFYVDIHDELTMLVSDHRATTFAFDEPIQICSGAYKFSLAFNLQEGEGRFLGHRMLGNRLSQINLKGKHRYHAYDWQVFMRTIKRSEHCVIKASLRFE